MYYDLSSDKMPKTSPLISQLTPKKVRAIASTIKILATKSMGMSIKAREHNMPIPQILKMIFLICLLDVSAPFVNWKRLMYDKRRKKATAEVLWIMCEILTGNWKNPTMSLAAGQLQGNMTIINPKKPARRCPSACI